MKTKWTSMMIIAFILLSGAAAAHGQEVAKPSNRISELKEQIAKFAGIENDEAVPAEVKGLNHGFLEERRAQLRALLETKLNALRTYRATVGSALTPEEARVVDGSIQDLEKELRELQPGAAQPAPAASSARAPRAPLVPAEPAGVEAARAGGLDATPLTHAAPPQAAATPPSFAPAGGDTESSNPIREDIRRQLAAVVREVTTTPLRRANQTVAQARMEAIDITANPQLYAELLALILTNKELPHEEFVRDIEAARIDKQTGGSGGGTAGSTTLVSKGGTPAVLGFATEHGGLERSIDGTTVTFRGNPVGLVEAFQKTGFIPSYNDSQSTKLLRKLSFSLSFDTSRGDTPGTFLANRQQLSSYSFRYEFKNDRDPRNPKYAEKWAELVRGHAQKVANALGSSMRLLDTNPQYAAWLEETKRAVAAAGDSQLPDVIAQRFELFQQIDVPPDLAAFVNSFQTEFTKYRQERDSLLDIVANAPIFTLEYVNNRRPGLIDTSTLNFIAETGMFEGKADLTFNGTLTFFNADPGAGMKRVRSFDNSLRLDVPLGDMRRFGAFLTFAGKYKRMLEDDKTSGGTAMATKGDIATGQLLLTIPVGRSGFKIPISMSFANRTEFIKEKEVKGNFGFTFDLDSILEKLKPF
jgi:hypothetical protein